MADRHCPRCEVGILHVVADDDNGTNLRCFYCEWAGTEPKRVDETRRGARRPEGEHSTSGGLRSPIPTGASKGKGES